LKNYWAFSVDDDLHVVFRWEGEEAFLVNLGSHDQVY
jgi:mRNA-degrading endonuclease YafQ of YafQ-DinJ toxin-antitoxin module